jgi:magnesium-protoporphyrin O-methyltransferase
MQHTSYLERREKIEHYFDRTAAKAWEVLTSNAPVGRIRRTVREGRDQMRATLLSWLPQDMHGMRLLDAGCGTGALAMEAMRRGADVVAIDLSPTLIQLARERSVNEYQNGPGRIEFLAGDMLETGLGHFDYVIAMDSLIHYDTPDIVEAFSTLAQRTRKSIIFTFAPRTPLLAVMHSLGRLFPKSERSPSLEPVLQSELYKELSALPNSSDWRAGKTQRISSGFYKSQAWEWLRA